MEAHPQRRPAALAAAAAVLLVGSMFLDWYRLDLPSEIAGRKIEVPTYSAFEGLERSDIYLVVAAAVALILAGMLWAGVLSNSPAPGLALLVAGLFAVALVVYRGSERPGRLLFGDVVDTTLRPGWFIALVAAALIAMGGVLAYLAGPRLQFEDEEFDEDEDEDPQAVGDPPGRSADS
jgi:hypothetical protein